MDDHGGMRNLVEGGLARMTAADIKALLDRAATPEGGNRAPNIWYT